MLMTTFHLSNNDGMVNFVDFGTYDKALQFIGMFNNIKHDNGKITFSDICKILNKEISKDLVDSYSSFGFLDSITFGMIHESNNSESGPNFRVCLPMKICDFRPKENG